MKDTKTFRAVEVKFVDDSGCSSYDIYVAPEINTKAKFALALKKARIAWKNDDPAGYADTVYCLKKEWAQYGRENTPFVFTMELALENIPEEYLIEKGIALCADLETFCFDWRKKSRLTIQSIFIKG